MVLTGLSKALKVGTEHVYGVLVRQQVVNSVVNLIISIVTIILGYMGYRCLKLSQWGSSHSYYDSQDPKSMYWIGYRFNFYAFLTLILGPVTIILLVISLISIPETITGFINPEYGAIKDIISFIK